MAFFEDIRNYIPLNECDAPIQLVALSYVVITGHKGIKSYTEQKIVFHYKHQKIIIEGDNLKIIYLSKEEAYINGKIKGVYFDA